MWNSVNYNFQSFTSRNPSSKNSWLLRWAHLTIGCKVVIQYYQEYQLINLHLFSRLFFNYIHIPYYFIHTFSILNIIIKMSFQTTSCLNQNPRIKTNQNLSHRLFSKNQLQRKQQQQKNGLKQKQEQNSSQNDQKNIQSQKPIQNSRDQQNQNQSYSQDQKNYEQQKQYDQQQLNQQYDQEQNRQQKNNLLSSNLKQQIQSQKKKQFQKHKYNQKQIKEKKNKQQQQCKKTQLTKKQKKQINQKLINQQKTSKQRNAQIDKRQSIMRNNLLNNIKIVNSMSHHQNIEKASQNSSINLNNMIKPQTQKSIIKYNLSSKVWKSLKIVYIKLAKKIQNRVKVKQFFQNVFQLSQSFLNTEVIEITVFKKKYTLRKILFTLQKKYPFNQKISWRQLEYIISNFQHAQQPTIDKIFKSQKIIEQKNNFFLIQQAIDALKQIFRNCKGYQKIWLKSKKNLIKAIKSQNILQQFGHQKVAKKKIGSRSVYLWQAFNFFKQKATSFVDLDEFLMYFSETPCDINKNNCFELNEEYLKGLQYGLYCNRFKSASPYCNKSPQIQRMQIKPNLIRYIPKSQQKKRLPIKSEQKQIRHETIPQQTLKYYKRIWKDLPQIAKKIQTQCNHYICNQQQRQKQSYDVPNFKVLQQIFVSQCKKKKPFIQPTQIKQFNFQQIKHSCHDHHICSQKYSFCPNISPSYKFDLLNQKKAQNNLSIKQKIQNEQKIIELKKKIKKIQQEQRIKQFKKKMKKNNFENKNQKINTKIIKIGEDQEEKTNSRRYQIIDY